MPLPTPFTASTRSRVLQDDATSISTPEAFDHLGALQAAGEDDGDFDDFCSAIRLVGHVVESDEDLAEAIVVLLNRAHAHGSLKPIH